MKNEIILVVVVLILSYVSGQQDTIVYQTATEKNNLLSHMSDFNLAFGSGVINTGFGGKSLLTLTGFIFDNSTNEWLPESDPFSIKFLSPSTFSVFGFDTVTLTNANNGNCVVKTVCASNEFNCFQNNVTRATSNCGRTPIKLSYNKNSIVSLNAEVNIGGTKQTVTAKFYKLIWNHITDIGEEYAAIARVSKVMVKVDPGVIQFEPVIIDFERNTLALFYLTFTGATYDIPDLREGMFYLTNYTAVETASNLLMITGGVFNINGYSVEDELIGVIKMDGRQPIGMEVSVSGVVVNVNGNQEGRPVKMFVRQTDRFRRLSITGSTFDGGTMSAFSMDTLFAYEQIFYQSNILRNYRSPTIFKPMKGGTSTGLVLKDSEFRSCITVNQVVMVDETYSTDTSPVGMIVTGNSIRVAEDTTPSDSIVFSLRSFAVNQPFDVRMNKVVAADETKQATIMNGIGIILGSIVGSGKLSCTSSNWKIGTITGPAKYVMFMNNSPLNTTVTSTWCRDPSTYNTCSKYCSPNLSIPDFCIVDTTSTTTTVNYGWNTFPELTGIPQYCNYIKILVGTRISQSLPLLIDCGQAKTKNAIIEQLTRSGRSGKPIVDVSAQLVLAKCDSITISNIDFRTTSAYPDADYIVDYLEEEPLSVTLTSNVFTGFPRGVFRHTTVNGLTVTGNIFTAFGRAAFILDPDNEGNLFTRSIITATENPLLSTPATMTISSNTLSGIVYVTFVNIQSTRGSVTINNNICQNTLCGWANDYNISTVPIYVYSDSSLSFVKVVLATRNAARTISIKSNSFVNTVQTPSTDLVIRGQFKKQNPYHDTYTAIGISGDGVNVVFDVKTNTISGYPTGIRVPDIPNSSLQTNYVGSTLLKDDARKYIRQWLVVNPAITTLNMDIWRVRNTEQLFYRSISDDYCHRLCPTVAYPTDIIDYCIVNPKEPSPLTYVYSSLTAALSGCIPRSDGTRELRLSGGNYTLTGNPFINTKYLIRPHGSQASTVTTVLRPESEIYDEKTAVFIVGTFTLNNATVTFSRVDLANTKISKVTPNTKDSTLFIVDSSIYSNTTITSVSNIDIRNSKITGAMSMVKYDYLTLERNTISIPQFEIYPLKFYSRIQDNTFTNCSDTSKPCVKVVTKSLCGHILSGNTIAVTRSPTEAAIHLTFNETTPNCTYTNLGHNVVSNVYRPYGFFLSSGPSFISTTNKTDIMRMIDTVNPSVKFIKGKIFWDNMICCTAPTVVYMTSGYITITAILVVMLSALTIHCLCLGELATWSHIDDERRMSLRAAERRITQ
jgi:hypothetical protein